MSNSNGMYNVLNIFKKLQPTQEQSVKAEAQAIYESVEAKGSIVEGVKSVEQKLRERYEATKSKKAKKDYDKDGEIESEKDEVIGSRRKAAGLDEERETLKTKGGTIYKGGTYGTDFDGSDAPKKPKHVPKTGQRGRPKAEKPASFDAPKGDIFGRTTGVAPKGKKGTMVKGKANQDTVDEAAKPDYLDMDKDGNKKETMKKAISDKKKVSEGVNFSQMMQETHGTLEEMLGQLQTDVQEFKKSGKMSEPLRDCMSVYEYGKKSLTDGIVPRGPSFAPQHPGTPEPKPGFIDKAKAMGHKALNTLGHGSDDELLSKLERETGGKRPNSYNEGDQDLNELARLAGLSESMGCMSPMGNDAQSMEQQQGKINVSTNMSSDGNKSVSINADGEAADQLVQMLKMAGLGGQGGEPQHAKLAIAVPAQSDSGEEEVDEAVGATAEYANTPNEEYEDVQAITNQGDDMNRQKKQFADKPKAGDNPMATETKAPFGRDLMAEYQSLKLKK